METNVCSKNNGKKNNALLMLNKESREILPSNHWDKKVSLCVEFLHAHLVGSESTLKI